MRASTGTANETLIRLLAASVALGLPVVVFWPRGDGLGGDAEHEAMRGAIGAVVSAVEKYKLEAGEWPDRERGLTVLSAGQAAPTASYYMSPGQLLDPWERPYLYVFPGAGGAPFEVMSYGADGRPGGKRKDRDLGSWEIDGPQEKTQ